MQYYVSAPPSRAHAVKPDRPAPKGPGYLVDADDRAQALRSVKAFRAGHQWADALAQQGRLQVLR